jgi:hypothetical protein
MSVYLSIFLCVSSFANKQTGKQNIFLAWWLMDKQRERFFYAAMQNLAPEQPRVSPDEPEWWQPGLGERRWLQWRVAPPGPIIPKQNFNFWNSLKFQSLAGIEPLIVGFWVEWSTTVLPGTCASLWLFIKNEQNSWIMRIFYPEINEGKSAAWLSPGTEVIKQILQ